MTPREAAAKIPAMAFPHLWAVFGWTVVRAVLFIALVSAAIHRLTGDVKLVKAYCLAHTVAISLGALADAVIVLVFYPKGGLSAGTMNVIFLAPIAFFMGFSLYLCHRDTVLRLGDVLLTLAPILAWGCLVVWGWQNVGDYDVLGAWFVSAACGGVDLIARFGPEPVRRRQLAAKVAGYAAAVLAVYLVLPYTGAR